ncbi:transmembrane protein 70 homolog, mitochondrial [Ostrinia furnacalis]|uniref:transmembrane protein 70 homolog, mitochondrial n=1 Tax=Ostrinia furnacalis TaxID=93504 RepID=UPI00103A2C4C|nr:transmembrane protein 70 homolog, mitochondrial [Ostrinia furnacalis]
MLRLCLQTTCFQSKSLFQHNLHKQISSKLKCIGVCHNNVFRQLSTDSKEEEELEHIYSGPLTPQIKAVKIFSLTSSVAGLMAQPIIVKQAATIGSTSLLVVICSMVGFFTFITPLLLHFVTKKYVTDMHYDPSTGIYKATTINFFLVEKELEFKSEDVTVPDIPGMFTTMHAKGKPLFIEARHFSNPLHYAKIMGYDKPMDFKLGEVEEEERK